MSARVGRMETPSSKALTAERLGRSLTHCWWDCKADSSLGVPQKLNLPLLGRYLKEPHPHKTV